MAADEKRREAIVQALERARLAALVCFSPANVLLLSGYWPVMGTSLAAVSAGGGRLVIVPEDEQELARSTSDAELLPYQPETLHRLTNPAEALAGPVRDLIARLGVDGKRVGVDLQAGSEGVSYQSQHRFRSSVEPLLRQASTGVSIVSADDLLAELRSVKTPVELERIRAACALAGAGFREAETAVRAGRREDEVAAEIEAGYARVAFHGFERGRGYFFCMSGPHAAQAAGAYARTRSREIEGGDFVMIHANTVGDGYWTDITRNYVPGERTAQQDRMAGAIAEAREAALPAVKPGAAAKDVDGAARRVLERAGFGAEFKHATGHGVGFAAADANALPRIHPESPDVLQAGMTFNIEPAIYLDGEGGMRHCDVVACTEAGAEVLTRF